MPRLVILATCSLIAITQACDFICEMNKSIANLEGQDDLGEEDSEHLTKLPDYDLDIDLDTIEWGDDPDLENTKVKTSVGSDGQPETCYESRKTGKEKCDEGHKLNIRQKREIIKDIKKNY